jgi:transposase
MASPYSDDLRQKAVDAIDRGERQSQVCQMFNISRNTLNLWLKRRQQTEEVGAIRDYRRGPQPKIADLEQFRDFAQRHGHLTQQDMAEQWCEPISDRTIGKALKRIEFTRQKRHIAIERGMKPSAKHFERH